MAAPRKTAIAPRRAEIIWIRPDPQAEREMKGMHPMLVISTQAFNQRTGLVIGFPMTHADFNVDNPFAIAVHGPKKEVGYILCHQPKSFDWSARMGGVHPWSTVPQNILHEALQRLDTICGICSS